MRSGVQGGRQIRRQPRESQTHTITCTHVHTQGRMRWNPATRRCCFLLVVMDIVHCRSLLFALLFPGLVFAGTGGMAFAIAAFAAIAAFVGVASSSTACAAFAGTGTGTANCGACRGGTVSARTAARTEHAARVKATGLGFAAMSAVHSAHGCITGCTPGWSAGGSIALFVVALATLAS